MELDYGREMIWSLSEMTGGPLPPYLLEIVMKDGRSYYVYTGNSRDEKSQSVVVDIWDLRAVDSTDEAEILKLLDDPKAWNEADPNQPGSFHHSLSIGRLRCKLDDILYVVEWCSRIWNIENLFTTETGKKIGFVPSD